MLLPEYLNERFNDSMLRKLKEANLYKSPGEAFNTVIFREMPPEKPTLAMEIFPPFAEFIEFGGASKHTLTNTGGSRMVFKVKCSNNAIFKVWFRNYPGFSWFNKTQS